MMKQINRIIPAALTALLVFAGCEQPTDGKFEGRLNNMASPVVEAAILISRNSVKIDWKPVTGAANYTVSRSSASDGTYTPVGKNIATTTYTDTGLSASTTYYYRVSAFSSDGASSLESSAASATTYASGLLGYLAYIQASAVNNSAYTIELEADETIAPTTLSYSGKTVSITLKGKDAARTLTLQSSGSLFTIGSGVKLILDHNVTLKGISGNTAALLRVNTGGTLEMNAGAKISGNTTSTSSSTVGGGVYVSGTFIMNGGEISGNTATSSSSYICGGGVYVSGGTFTMSGGEISGNTATSSSSYICGGGGVYVSGGTFTMSGGEISGNTASASSSSSYASGGGVYVSSSGKFSKTNAGGTIYGSNAADTMLKNSVLLNGYSVSNGHAVYAGTNKVCNNTVGADTALDSMISGANGGWK
ncbi:MAG: fibronectin type III domain-containing protein [Treponema sp.]|jgi:hypothetical protein|nr:fibronectin type III domain-containing protein [Treponema sp.]